jgi:hypothetical protein
MSVETGWENFYKAFFFAVASKEPVRQRLSGVVSTICDLARDSFPDNETWYRFQLLIAGNTKLSGSGNLDAITTTISQMPEEEAVAWLLHAFTLFSDLAYAYGRENP